MQNNVDFIAIKRSVSISDVLSKYIRIPHRDKYRVACPIHGGESWNSFSVDNKLGLFHCFVCQIGGDAISLYAKLEGISNIEAARRLSEEYEVHPSSHNFNMTWDEVKRWEPKQLLPEIDLPPSMLLHGYRGYSREAINHFGLRQVPTGILIPFKDEVGRMVGYAIRQIDRDPKYLNSKDFRKSDVLYGLFENRDHIIDAGMSVVVCEGQFSAIRIWDSGHKNVVATLGASMSPSQANLLGHFAGKVIILYDGDEAGERGAAKIKEMYSSIFTIDIKHLQPDEDPDTGDLSILDGD